MNDRVQRLRRDLTEAVAAPTCPTGCRVRTFAADDAPTVHRLLEVGYAQGGGHIGAFEEWWPSLRDDDEFAPDLCFLAVNERQDIVGVAQCWTSAFIKDLVVHPLARRRGIATALLRRVFWEFRRRGVKHVDLKVQVDNPTGAVRLYSACIKNWECEKSRSTGRERMGFCHRAKFIGTGIVVLHDGR